MLVSFVSQSKELIATCCWNIFDDTACKRYIYEVTHKNEMKHGVQRN